jgi:hypothetical protein
VQEHCFIAPNQNIHCGDHRCAFAVRTLCLRPSDDKIITLLRRESMNSESNRITLTDAERERFALYLLADVAAAEAMAERIGKSAAPGTAAIALQYRNEAMASRIVAAKLCTNGLDSVHHPDRRQE